MRKLQNGKKEKTWAISCQECLTEQLRSRERETEKAKWRAFVCGVTWLSCFLLVWKCTKPNLC